MGRSGEKLHLVSIIKHRHGEFDSLNEMKLLLEVLFLAIGFCITNGASVDSAKLQETCTWSGTSPICEGKCSKNEITLATSQCGDGAHCVSGDKKLCCTADLYKDCYWDGTAPVCSGECKGDYETVSDSKCGDGHECFTGLKKLCCIRK